VSVLQLPAETKLHRFTASVSVCCDVPRDHTIVSEGDVYIYGICRGSVACGENNSSHTQMSTESEKFTKKGSVLYIRRFSCASIAIDGISLHADIAGGRSKSGGKGGPFKLLSGRPVLACVHLVDSPQLKPLKQLKNEYLQFSRKEELQGRPKKSRASMNISKASSSQDYAHPLNLSSYSSNIGDKEGDTLSAANRDINDENIDVDDDGEEREDEILERNIMENLLQQRISAGVRTDVYIKSDCKKYYFVFTVLSPEVLI
jgi:hypothetical protein